MFLIRKLSVLLVLCIFAACSQAPADPLKEPAASNKTRPPLRLWLVDAAELEKELQSRWLASSDQPIAIEKLSLSELQTRESFAFDVIIFPGQELGEMVERDAISKLPSQVVTKRISSTGNSETNSIQREAPQKEDLSSAWPARFRNIASYGGKLYAIPLGANPMALISRGWDVQPLANLQSSPSTSSDKTDLSLAEWGALLTPIEAEMGSAQGKAELSSKLAALSDREKEALVDRFLWVASTTNARQRGLFELAKMKSRLAEPDLIAAAEIVGRLYRLFPETFCLSHPESWAQLLSKPAGSKTLAIGWPGATLQDMEAESNAASENDTIQIASIVWGPNRGLLASVGKATRQSSVSNQFLAWLSEPEQRESLRSVCTRVELLPDQPDRNLSRGDYRKYYAESNKKQSDGMELSLRLVHSRQYRSVLADSLLKVIESPDEVTNVMTECSAAWNALTESFGLDRQRSSEERSLGFEK